MLYETVMNIIWNSLEGFFEWLRNIVLLQSLVYGYTTVLHRERDYALIIFKRKPQQRWDPSTGPLNTRQYTKAMDVVMIFFFFQIFRTFVSLLTEHSSLMEWMIQGCCLLLREYERKLCNLTYNCWARRVGRYHLRGLSLIVIFGNVFNPRVRK